MVSLRAWQSSAIATVCRGVGSGSSRMCRVLVAGVRVGGGSGAGGKPVAVGIARARDCAVLDGGMRMAWWMSLVSVSRTCWPRLRCF